MSKKNQDKLPIWLSFGVAAAALVVIVIIFALLVPRKQEPSDCTDIQKFNQATERCIDKTADDYQNEKTAREEENKRAAAEQLEAEKRSGKTCVNSSEARNYVGVNGCVSFRVGHIFSQYGRTYLNGSQDPAAFSAVALQKGLITFQEAEANYLGKMLVVSGTVSLYENNPQIIVNSKDQIKVVDEAEQYRQLNEKLKTSNAELNKSIQSGGSLMVEQKQCQTSSEKKSRNDYEKAKLYDICMNGS